MAGFREIIQGVVIFNGPVWWLYDVWSADRPVYGAVWRWRRRSPGPWYPLLGPPALSQWWGWGAALDGRIRLQRFPITPLSTCPLPFSMMIPISSILRFPVSLRGPVNTDYFRRRAMTSTAEDVLGVTWIPAGLWPLSVCACENPLSLSRRGQAT